MDSSLHFSSRLAIVADGYQLKLNDPCESEIDLGRSPPVRYSNAQLCAFLDNRPTLYVRRPGSDAEEIHTFHDDDPFYAEISSFCSAVEGKKDGEGVILSSFEDGQSAACGHNLHIVNAQLNVRYYRLRSRQDIRNDLGDPSGEREIATRHAFYRKGLRQEARWTFWVLSLSCCTCRYGGFGDMHYIALRSKLAD